MGVDLTLMPLLAPGFWAAHDNLNLARRRELWAVIEGLGEVEIPEPVSCHHAVRGDGEKGYGELEYGPYETRLTYLTAGQLMSIADHEAVQDNWKNRGIWKLLGEMPEDWKIVLYWH